MSAQAGASEVPGRIRELCRRFHLPTVAAEAEPRFAAAGQAAALPTLAEVLELEAEDRRQRRVARLRYGSKLPPGKTAATFDPTRLPPKLQHQLGELAGGGFLERSVNVLAFGLPGTGKTHGVCALGHALVEAGHAVYFTPAYRLVQELLAAKRDLALPRALRKLDQFEVVILDDLGYVQQDPAEAEVLFTLLAERYERRSLVITSNLVFSQWDQIFRNPMATAAAIDRIVHHSVILEFDVPSYRTEAAKRRLEPVAERERSAASRPKSRPAEPVGTKSPDEGRAQGRLEPQTSPKVGEVKKGKK
jgi:DNA replication protein DnaC